MKKFSINLVRILILFTLGLCIICITSKVNAGTERFKGTFNLTVGEEKRMIDPGMETTYGKITKIKVSDKKIAEVKEEVVVGADSKSGSGSRKFRIFALKEGTTTVTVEFYRKSSFKCTKSKAYYTVNVSKVVKNPDLLTLTKEKQTVIVTPGMKKGCIGSIEKVYSNNAKIATAKVYGTIGVKITAGETDGKTMITVKYKPAKKAKETEIQYIVENKKNVEIKFLNNYMFQPIPVSNSTNKPVQTTNKQTTQKTTTKQTTQKTTTKQTTQNDLGLIDVNGNKIEVDDKIKMTKGNAWFLYTDSSLKKKESKTIQFSQKRIYKITEIEGNAVHISYDDKDVGWMKWYNTTKGASNYFTIQ